MGVRAKPKAWGERLPLDDMRGLRLLAAAIYHAKRLEYERSSSVENVQLAEVHERLDTPDPDLAASRVAKRVDQAKAQMLLWRNHLAELGTSDEEIVAGESATLQDFIFDPADLWRHKHLALCLVEGRGRFWPEFDRDTPICRNSDLWPLKDLLDLAHQYWRWHLAPAHAKPILNRGFGQRVEHIHWRNYLAPYCEAPRRRGHPKGSRWHDARKAAAEYAWSLLHAAAKEQRELSVSEAVRRSVSSFTYLKSSDPEPPRREAKRFIRAISENQAEKSVRKILDGLIAGESPWGPFEN